MKTVLVALFVCCLVAPLSAFANDFPLSMVALPQCCFDYPTCKDTKQMTRDECGGKAGGAWKDNPSSPWNELVGVCECYWVVDSDKNGRPEPNMITSFTPTTNTACESYAEKNGWDGHSKYCTYYTR